MTTKLPLQLLFVLKGSEYPESSLNHWFQIISNLLILLAQITHESAIIDGVNLAASSTLLSLFHSVLRSTKNITLLCI